MTYPVLSRADAKIYLDRVEVDDAATLEGVQDREGGADLDWEELASQVSTKLSALAKKFGVIKSKTDPNARRFEAEASVIVHRGFPPHRALADPEFWTWASVAHFRKIVAWRYRGSKNAANYGAGSPIENMTYRLWLRGDVSHQPGEKEPYKLAALGDVDFWRSHIFRQSYANGAEFARALIKFQFAKGADGKPTLPQEAIRELVKRLKTARSNLLVELMDEERATRFIKAESAKLEAMS